ncbi:Fic family protein [Teichococcus aestuarii]|uniref:Cell filamentation protein Fic n=1 Tax=Teichococcus aestuarii TaxID=568898 RepID=A0A2U1UYH1_9PROT|nr:Fic family protein [Pseudoroseomonas aestuarii]PWC26651.1 cell filamentation protein Fic [Pseudoroseomonas aestuarii]
MLSKVEGSLVGQAALIASLELRRPPPAVISMVGVGARRTVTEDGRTVERYPVSYQPEDTLAGHLRFALRYEPIDLGILSEAFGYRAAAEQIEAWVRSEPTGAYARRAWFLFEWLTGKQLDLPDAGPVGYVDALDAKLHIIAKGSPSRRHKVTNNILGSPGFAPLVRRTQRLVAFMKEDLAAEARNLVAGCEPEVLARAVNYLYTKETKSSFAIERETATGKKAERFVAALRSAKSFEPTDPQSLIDLQNIIVDARYAAKDLRDFQNFVGSTVGGYREEVHFICPRPEDVRSLVADWAAMTERLKEATDPVVAAALTAFGFVFIHPFEDGNGRIHRFLIHQVLAREGFTPPNILFPVSAAIVRDLREYDTVLETFSGPIMPHIDWHWTPAREITVDNDTAHLYRYFDATPLAEFLYAKVAATIRKDLKEELEFVAVYDAAKSAVDEIIDMPDRKASLLVRLCLQNSGRLSKAKREMFSEIEDHEIEAIEAAIQEIIAGHTVLPPEEDFTP